MHIKQASTLILGMLCTISAAAQNQQLLNVDSIYSPYTNNPDFLSISDFNQETDFSNDDWIKIKSSDTNNSLSVAQTQDLTFGNELAIAWNLSDSFSLNLSFFENQLANNFFADNNTQTVNVGNNQRINKSLINEGFNDLSLQQPNLDVNSNLTGYKLGISSQMGFGNNYKLNFNFDYGQVDGANLSGFNDRGINTTSFALGIRKAKFGASLNTDTYLEDSTDIMDRSRLGLEFDWHFSDDTTISFGTKQRLNKDVNRTSTLDSITGNVQYIKFKHNL